jgi:hypothetical protein
MISGRIGTLKTFGRGMVEPLAEPSADRIETVGREAISNDLMTLSLGGGWRGVRG